MYPYRKILELHADNVSLRSIAMITQHSRQKIEYCGLIEPLSAGRRAIVSKTQNNSH